MKGTQLEREGIERRHRWDFEGCDRIGGGGGLYCNDVRDTIFPEFGQFITCYTYNVISQIKPGTYSSETYIRRTQTITITLAITQVSSWLRLTPL